VSRPRSPLPRRRRDADRDGPARLGELDRVADEVRHDLADPLRVVADPDRGVGQGQPEVDPAAPGGLARLLHGRFDGDPQVVGAKVEEDEPGIELRELEQVLGQPVQALELDPAVVEELGPGDRIVPGPLGQQLVEGQEGGDRRP
jgi:hypothetical protein